MDTLIWGVIGALLGLLLGAGLTLLLVRRRQREAGLEREREAGQLLEDARKEARRVLGEAEEKARRLLKEAESAAREERSKAREGVEAEYREQRRELGQLEERLRKKEEGLQKKEDLIDQKEVEVLEKERALAKAEKALQEKEREVEEALERQRAELERISGMTQAEAKEHLLKAVEQEARQDAARLLKRIEAETKETADRKAREIISLAISRCAGEFVAERTVSGVALPSEEMKGRIIGREGRNIRAFEAATGVDLIIDDTPEAVVLSAFDPVRREIARIAMERLVADGRIHPARIEEMVRKVEKEVDMAIREAGEQAVFDVGIYEVHPELVRYLGKLRYRTSYAQNVLQHSVEVAFLAGIMASELGLDPKLAKRAGLLHDIGKAVDHEVEGPHAVIGAELARKYGEGEPVIHAIHAHHEDVKPETVLAVLVQAADALSGARPGARREMLETYVKRLQDLERIAKSFPGVQKSYAIQAGREIRIMVESAKVSDEESVLLARDVAKRIEEELSYPGQIKVTVIRETRAVEYAK